MGNGLHEITCSIARSLVRATGWLSAVDRGGEKVYESGEKVVPDENHFEKRSRSIARSIGRSVDRSLGRSLARFSLGVLWEN